MLTIRGAWATARRSTARNCQVWFIRDAVAVNNALPNYLLKGAQMGTVRSLYESADAAKAAPKLSNDPAAFRHFDLRNGLVTEPEPRPLRVLAGVLVLLFVLGVAGWLAANSSGI